MSWKGTFKKLEPGDQWSQEERIIGVLVNDFDSGIRYETIVDKEIVEDDGKPFEEGEEIEILIRRVSDLPLRVTRITSEQLEKMVDRTTERLEQPIPDSVLEAWKQEVRTLLTLALSMQGEV